MYGLVRALLFRKDPEDAHRAALGMAAWASRRPWALRWLVRRGPGADAHGDPRLRRRVWGLAFPNPLGLAAGFDKDGVAVPAMAALGFGFVEVGTVTPRPQEGNPRPRMFRHPSHRALVNRLGFPSAGVDRVADNLREGRTALARAGDEVGLPQVPVGVNVGPNRGTDLDDVHADVAACLKRLWDVADYFVVNVSSPNTPGLRDLEEPDRLGDLLRRVLDARDDLGDVPLLVKLSPDRSPAELRALAGLLASAGVDGVVATNTSADPKLLPGAEEGGISGRPLGPRSLTALGVLRATLAKADAAVPLVACGGILDGADAKARLDQGAALLQCYTALVYRGPAAAGAVLGELADLLPGGV